MRWVRGEGELVSARGSHRGVGDAEIFAPSPASEAVVTGHPHQGNLVGEIVPIDGQLKSVAPERVCGSSASVSLAVAMLALLSV